MTIDGIDAYMAYGVTLREDGFNALASVPSFKSLPSNNWHEYDGVEVDLTAPVLDSRRVVLSFNISDVRKLADLRTDLEQGAEHTIFFSAPLRTVLKARLYSMDSLATHLRLGYFTLTLIEDTYSLVAADLAQITPCPYVQGVSLDGHDLAEYGWLVLRGTEVTFLQWPAVKENHYTKQQYEAGIKDYDMSHVRFAEKEATLKVHSRASAAEFWKRHRCLFGVLTAPGVHQIRLDNLSQWHNCYYGGSSVTKFAIGADGELWCDIDIRLRLLGA